MSVELGQNFKLYVGGGGSPETFTVVAGQRGLVFDAQSTLINTASKSSGIYGQQAAGRAQLSISVNGVRDLPDANGIERAYAAFKAQTPINIRICKTNVSPVAVKFAASMYISSFSQADNDQEEGTYSFQLTMAGTAATVDDLTP